MVGALYGCRKTLEASLVTPADIALRDIMATRENSISDSSQVDLNIFCPDVDQHDLETTISRIGHHLQIVLSGQSRLNGEALTSFNVLTSGDENPPGGSDRRRSADGWLESLTDSVGIEKRSLIDETRSAG
ncbi:MAG: hypothetical protein WB683_04235 [Candidatus Sulfotelmatobacter sp.]